MVKRLLSLILILLLLTTCPLGIPVHAREQSDERAEILEKACIAFPEYANKIESDALSFSAARSATSRELVITETRSISENEFIVYTEYSDGLIVLDQALMDSDVVYNTTEQSGSMTIFNITIKATCLETESYFKVSNLEFIIYPSAYDRITSIGTATTHNPENTYNDCCYYDAEECVYTPYETATDFASVCFPLQFKFAPYPGYIYDSYLWVEVGNNALSVHHDKR